LGFSKYLNCIPKIVNCSIFIWEYFKNHIIEVISIKFLRWRINFIFYKSNI
jgi:hypothetical protein